QTRQAAALAAAAGASLEAELGHVPLSGNADAPLPAVEEVVKFVDATGVDALAVAVGTVHGYYRRAPKIDLDLGRRAGAAVAIPLVLHGGSDTPRETIAALIRGGFAKVNVST
ncbi:MAG: class II fructose-bisphosphate aldolase, partial [Kiritimatiellia bacterium]